MKKSFSALLLTIAVGVFFGLRGSLMLIGILDKAGFLNWLSNNEWFIDCFIFIPTTILAICYVKSDCRNKKGNEKGGSL